MNGFILLALLAHGLFSVAQEPTYTLREDSLAPRNTEISVQVAFQTVCRQFPALFGREAVGDFQAGLFTTSLHRRTWDFVSQDYSVSVSAATGKIASADEDTARFKSRRGQLHGIVRVITTADQAEDRARSLAKNLGFRQDARITKCWIEETLERSPKCHLAWIPFHKNRRVMGPGASMSFDCLDGTLCSYYDRLDYTIETEEPVLTVDDAVVRATDAYGRVLPNGIEPYSYSGLDKPQCVYRVSTGEPVGPSRPQDADNYLVRCCWEVHFGKDKVWVDAVNGDCLGYYFFQRKSD